MPALVRLAVLPFENLGGGAEYDYLAEGLTEEIIVAVGLIDPARLAVVGRTSCLAYRGTSKSLEDIGRELGVDCLVEGSVRIADRRIRIASKLISATDRRQLWAATYDREMVEALIQLQVEMGRAIAGQIQVRFTPERAAMVVRRQTQHAAAYELYLRGRHFSNLRTASSVERALDCYREATDDARHVFTSGVPGPRLRLGDGARTQDPRARAVLLDRAHDARTGPGAKAITRSPWRPWRRPGGFRRET